MKRSMLEITGKPWNLLVVHALVFADSLSILFEKSHQDHTFKRLLSFTSVNEETAIILNCKRQINTSDVRPQIYEVGMTKSGTYLE